MNDFEIKEEMIQSQTEFDRTEENERLANTYAQLSLVPTFTAVPTDLF